MAVCEGLCINLNAGMCACLELCWMSPLCHPPSLGETAQSVVEGAARSSHGLHLPQPRSCIGNRQQAKACCQDPTSHATALHHLLQRPDSAGQCGRRSCSPQSQLTGSAFGRGQPARPSPPQSQGSGAPAWSAQCCCRPGPVVEGCKGQCSLSTRMCSKAHQPEPGGSSNASTSTPIAL